MPFDEITQDGRPGAVDAYWAALDRLKAGTPRVDDLRDRMAKGTLRINVTTVAVEAERARIPIARDVPEERFKAVRKAIIDENNRLVGLPVKDHRAGKTARALIDELRKENSNLADEVQKLTTSLGDAKRINRRLSADLKAALGSAGGKDLGDAARAARSAARTAARGFGSSEGSLISFSKDR